MKITFFNNFFAKFFISAKRQNEKKTIIIGNNRQFNTKLITKFSCSCRWCNED